jgi:hypothetical protein
VVEVLGEFGQIVTDLLALGIEVLQIFNFKLGGDGHDSLRSEERGKNLAEGVLREIR